MVVIDFAMPFSPCTLECVKPDRLPVRSESGLLIPI
jgi:hypothetical protein